MPKTAPTRVLLVEDDADVRRAVSQILTVMKFSVTCAVNGCEGVEQALAQRPDVILMDVRMPVLDGIEATRRIRQQPATARIPVIILSAYTDAGTRTTCTEAGASAFLSKPVGFQTLAATVNHWAAAGHPLPESKTEPEQQPHTMDHPLP